MNNLINTMSDINSVFLVLPLKKATKMILERLATKKTSTCHPVGYLNVLRTLNTTSDEYLMSKYILSQKDSHVKLTQITMVFLMVATN